MVTMPADPTKIATPEMVTMPTGQAKGAGPRKPVFHPGLGVEGVILPPPITSVLRQSAKSAAVSPAGARTVGEAPTAGTRKKFSFTERRSAGDILQRNHSNAGPNLSADWLRKVEWARNVIPDWKPSSKALAQAKRQRSQDTPAPSAKKSRVQPGRNQWRWVESALATHCFNLLEKEPGPPPICKDVGWFQGNVKVIACEDNRSAELYKAAVASVGEVYPGAKLEAVNWEDVPARPRARMWFPSTIKEPEQLLKMLQRCNPRLTTQIEETPGPTHQAVIILNRESLAPIDAAGGELNFGFSSVFIRVYKSDAAIGGAPSDKPVEEDITAELEAPERPEMDGYNSDASSLTRDLEVTSDLASDDDDANVTVVEGKSTDVHCKAASAALLLRLAGGGADVVLIQEPWMVCGKVSGLGSPDYKLFVANTQVSLESQPAPIRLLSGYMPYDQVGLIPEDIARSLISDSADNKIDLIVGCDANAHHTQWGSSNTNARGSINIYSDSQAAIKSIAATTTNSISVSKCRKSLHEMAGHFDICLIWVPGHQDIPGNCIADELARIGTTNVLLPDKEDTSMPLATCKLMLHYQSNHKSTLRWQASLVGRVARQTWPKIDKARTVTLCNLSRRNCSLVVRSLTGHWLIGTHAHRLNSPYNDFCRSCRDEEEVESPEHFFCSCPALSSRRLRTLGKPFLDDLGGLSAISPRKIALFIQLSNWILF
ncbi:hypothetical protein ACLKA7_000811 [Drosophila subpalustris]